MSEVKSLRTVLITPIVELGPGDWVRHSTRSFPRIEWSRGVWMWLPWASDFRVLPW